MERAKAAGRKVSILDDRPRLSIRAAFAWQAFAELGGCRNYSGAPIAWTAVRSWAAEHCGSAEEFDDLLFLVRELDGVLLKHQAEELEAKTRPTQ